MTFDPAISLGSSYIDSHCGNWVTSLRRPHRFPLSSVQELGTETTTSFHPLTTAGRLGTSFNRIRQSDIIGLFLSQLRVSTWGWLKRNQTFCVAANLAIISSALFLFQNYETYFCLDGHLWNRSPCGVTVKDYVPLWIFFIFSMTVLTIWSHTK